jgi:hypothetical protein
LNSHKIFEICCIPTTLHFKTYINLKEILNLIVRQA